MKQVEHEEIKLRLGDVLFTWDDEKERINIRKHEIDFTVAATVFMDNDVLLEFNSVDEYTGEERWDAIGLMKGPYLFVVYVERTTSDNDDIIRIISARKAERKEIQRYLDGY